MTTQKELLNYLEVEFIDKTEYVDKRDVVTKLNLIVDNHLGFKRSSYGSPWMLESSYSTICKFIYEHTLEKKIIKENRFFNDDNMFLLDEDDLNTYKNYIKYILNPGFYIFEFPDHTFFILDSSMMVPDESEYSARFDIYIIGDKFKKYKKKMNSSIFNRMKERDVNPPTYICTAYARNPVRFKSFDKMIFKNKDSILSYIDKFIKNIPEYYRLGINPKLSFLIYGKPGTGKSTFYQALAKYLGISDVRVMSPSEFSDSSVDASKKIRYNGIIALDDIDCICTNREIDSSKENTERVHNILSFLDNPPTYEFMADDGRFYPISIVVATTNYIDKLDTAIKRFGRFDVTFEMDYFNKEESESFCNIFGLSLSDLSSDIKFPISPAELQAMCIEKVDKSLKGKVI